MGDSGRPFCYYLPVLLFSHIYMNATKFFSSLFIFTLLAACGTTVSTETEMEDEATSSEAMENMEDTEATESSLTFVGGSSLVDHDGGFSSFTVELTGSEDPTEATLTATIDLGSVYTDSERLTGHLQQEEFFDVENYPEATFTSTSIVTDGENTYDITGNLTIKDITKEIIMDDVTITDDMIKASFDIPRKEFNVGNDSYGDKLLDELVPVEAVVAL